MDWMSSNETENNVSLKFSTEDEFSKYHHKALLAKKLGVDGGKGSMCSQAKSSKEAAADTTSTGMQAMETEIWNRSCCCSSWIEKLNILRCLIQTNAIALLLNCTFNNC